MSLHGFRLDRLPLQPGPVEHDLYHPFSGYYYPVVDLDQLKADLEYQEEIIVNNMLLTKAGMAGMVMLGTIGDAVSTLRQHTALQKVPALIKVIKKDLRNYPDMKIVVFARYKDTLEALRLALYREFRAVTLFPNSPPDEYKKRLEKFKKNKKCRVFLCAIKAASHAVDLTNTNEIIFADVDWDLKGQPNIFAIKRVYRQGQQKMVRIRFAYLKDTYDAEVTFVFKAQIDALMNATEMNSLYVKESEVPDIL